MSIHIFQKMRKNSDKNRMNTEENGYDGEISDTDGPGAGGEGEL